MPRTSTSPPTSNPTTPTANRPWTTRLIITTKTSTSTKKAVHDADSNPRFDEIPEDYPEDELDAWVDCITRATRKADDLLAANRVTSWILRQNQICYWQARMIAKHHEDRWTKLVSNWNPAISTKQKGYLDTKQDLAKKNWEYDLSMYFQPDGSNRDQRPHE